MIENEFKIILTSVQYEKIIAIYRWDKEVVQTNFYYDSDDFYMSNNRITVRVREIGSEYFLQMKLPHGEENEYFSREELEKILPELPREISGDELSAVSGISGLPTVKLLGSLATKRNSLKFDGGEIDLDRSEYFGKTDFELEIEFEDEGKARDILEQICRNINESLQNHAQKGKIRRFLEEFESYRAK